MNHDGAVEVGAGGDIAGAADDSGGTGWVPQEMHLPEEARKVHVPRPGVNTAGAWRHPDTVSVKTIYFSVIVLMTHSIRTF